MTPEKDHQVFSLQNSALLKPDRVTHTSRLQPLFQVGAFRDMMFVAVLLPDNGSLSFTHIGTPAELRDIQDAESSDDELGYTSTRYSDVIVKPKDLKHIPLHRRHGPAWRSMIFSAWSNNLQGTLEAQLLQWSPTGSPFHEIAFAVLCLASGVKNVALLPYEDYIKEQARLHEFISKDEPSDDLIFIANGVYSETLPPAAPLKTIYWLDGVLVHLASHLDQAELFKAQISFMVNYCDRNHAGETVDAILISIEHVVLLRIKPNAVLQRSALLTLFNLPNLRGMDPVNRSHTPDLEKRGDPDQREQATNRVEQRPSHTDLPLKDDEDLGLLLPTTQIEAEGGPPSTFFALCHVFEAAARRRLPFNDALGFGLPKEVILEILSYITDAKTRSNCLKVSRFFRDICQEKYMLADNMLLVPLQWEDLADPSARWTRWKVHNIATKTASVVNFKWTFWDLQWARRELQLSRWDLQCLSKSLASTDKARNRKSLMPDIQCEMIPE